MNSTMKRALPGAFWVYLAVALLGLFGTAWFNVTGFGQPGPGLIDSWFANPATSSLTIDLMAAATGASIFIVIEGRRLRMRLWWLYIAISFVTAVGFTFPLFLAMRERTLARGSDGVS